MFGGSDGVNSLNDTWVYDLSSNTWQEMNPEPGGDNPLARFGHAMAFDTSKNKVLLFGGRNGSYYNDTWFYDLTSNSWTLQNPSTKPSERSGSPMVFDPINNKMVIFGGFDGNYDDETWIYDTTYEKWLQKSSHILPPPRERHSMTYDSFYKKIVLFGGSHSSSPYRASDTWLFDIESNTWLEKKPLVNPSARYGHSMVYDSSNKITVLFGGWDGTYDNETWIYYIFNNTWLKVRQGSTPGADPSARYGHSMVYDSTNNLVILFGGKDSSGYNYDTWVYNSTANNWTKKRDGIPPSDPDPRMYGDMVYDLNNTKTILFGGYDGSNYMYDTWVYDYLGNNWIQKSIGGVEGVDKPNGRYGHTMVYDSFRNKTILYGGTYSDAELGVDPKPYYSDTWIYDYNTDTWSKKYPSNSPMGLKHHSMVFDSLNQRIIIFGGLLFKNYRTASTWAYDVRGLLVDKIMFVKTSEIYKNYLTDGDSAKFLNETDFINGIYTNTITLPSNSYVTAFSMKLCGVAGNVISKPVSDAQHYLPKGNQTNPDIYGNIVVWAEEINLSTQTYNIFYYDRANPEIDPKPLCWPSPNGSRNQLNPAIYDNIVVWQENGSHTNDWDIYMYDMEANEMRIISNASGDQINPAIYKDRIVWQDGRNFGKYPKPAIPKRFGHGMTSIFGEDKVMTFGGWKAAGQKHDDTWVFDYSNYTWTDKNPVNKPSARLYHAMAAVYGEDKTVLFGGHDGSYKGDTWIYDYSDNNWTKDSPSSKPSKRAYHSMSSIYGTDEVILFGGYDGSNTSNQAWIYNLTEGEWTKVDTGPGGRAYGMMAPIYGTDKVLLFGGNYAENEYQDTWIYDSSEDEWEIKYPATKPGKRTRHSMASIYGDDKVVLFGGKKDGTVYSDTWVYDLSENTWTKIEMAYEPDKSYQHAMATIDQSNHVLLFGGAYGSIRYNDTWIYECDLNIWHQNRESWDIYMYDLDTDDNGVYNYDEPWYGVDDDGDGFIDEEILDMKPLSDDLINNDGDCWSDDPAGTPNYYDLGIDEIIIDVDNDGIYNSSIDIVLYNGSTPGINTTNGTILNSTIDEDIADPGGIIAIGDPDTDPLYLDQTHPKIYEDKIVYIQDPTEYDGGINDDGDIFIAYLYSNQLNKYSRNTLGLKIYCFNVSERLVSGNRTQGLPNIYGDYVVFKDNYTKTVSDKDQNNQSIYLNNLAIYDIEAFSCKYIDSNFDSLDIYEDSVVYDSNFSSGIYGYDITMNGHKTLTPKNLETYFNPALYGSHVVFEYYNESYSSIYYYHQEYKLDIGNDGNYDWNSSKILMVNETTFNMKEILNNYLENHNDRALINIPLKFYSDVEKFNFSITDIDLHMDFLIDPLDIDTDGDKLWDGEELFLFAGFDIIEAEDTINFMEWRNPKVNLNMDFDRKMDTMINKDGNFIHQAGVTLTTSNDYVDSEGVLESWVKYTIKIEDTGRYRFIVNPEPSRFWGMTDEEEEEFEENGYSGTLPIVDFGAGNSVEVTEQVQHIIDKSATNKDKISYTSSDPIIYDFPMNYTADQYLNKLIEGSFYFEIHDKTRKIYSVWDSETSSVQRAVITTTPEGMNMNNLSVYADWEYIGEFELVHGVEYTITVGVDYSKIDPGLKRPSHVPFVNFIRLPCLDKIRVEKQSLDPLAFDADRDGLPDGVEFFGKNMYPLNPDADGDGLNDYIEIFETKTDPGQRDTDYDGIRDGVELGITPQYILYHHGELSSPGSWIERIAHSSDHSASNLSLINNYDKDMGTTVTDPLDFDTDDDGIPDGWIDGWSYNAFPFTFGDIRSYHTNNNRYQYFSYWRYNKDYWGRWNPVDMIVQIYEGEDLNLDGSPGSETGNWGFDENNTFESTATRETRADKIDSDNDGMPDGYEVWYSHIEPFRNSDNQYILNPTVNDASGDYDPNPGFVRFQYPEQSADDEFFIGPSVGEETIHARAQLLKIEEGGYELSDISKIKVRLYYFMGLARFELWVGEKVNGESYYKPQHLIWHHDIKLDCPTRWYPIDVPDNIFTLKNLKDENLNYFMVMRYLNQSFTWMGNENTTDNTANGDTWLMKSSGKWLKDVFNDNLKYKFDYELFEYDEDNEGDFLDNLDEFVIGTNPKDPDMDMEVIGEEILTDGLLDGQEIYSDPAKKIGGVIYRTNIQSGTDRFDNYQSASSSAWIRYDGDGSIRRCRPYKFEFKYVIENPDPKFKGASDDNQLLLYLDDNSQVYLSPDTQHKYMYVWSPTSILGETQTNWWGHEWVQGTCAVFKNIGEDYMLGGYQPNINYQGQELYLSNPFDIDTDNDGIEDGYDGFEWRYYDMEPDEAIPDWRICIRDEDSDNDGLLDIQEIMWCSDVLNVTDPDKLINMVDVDSDGDGIWDGDEIDWWRDTDGDGKSIEMDYDDDGEGDFWYNNRVNMLDPDSDNDGLADGWIDGMIWDWNATNKNGGKGMFVTYENYESIYGTILYAYPLEHPGAFDPWEGEDLNVNRKNDQGEPSPTKVDSDQDGLWDGFDKYNSELETLMYYGELYYYDYQAGKGIPFSGGYEQGYKPAQRSAHEGTNIQMTSQTSADTDSDGLSDVDESVYWSITLEDWIPWIQRNNANYQKIYNALNLDGDPFKLSSDPNLDDTDDDGLTDYEEYLFTNPLDKDSDNDGLSDLFENPNKNKVVDKGETNPCDRDSDDDYLCDGWNDGGRANVVAVITSGQGIIDGPDGWTVNDDNTPWSTTLPLEDYEYGEYYYLSAGPPNTLHYLTFPNDPDSDDDNIVDGAEYLYLWRHATDGPFQDSDSDQTIKKSTLDIRQKDSDMDGLTDGEENWNCDDLDDFTLVGYYYGDTEFSELLYYKEETETNFEFSNFMTGRPWSYQDDKNFSIIWEGKFKVINNPGTNNQKGDYIFTTSNYGLLTNVTFNISGPNMTYYGNSHKHVSLNHSAYDFTVTYKGSDYSSAQIKIEYEFREDGESEYDPKVTLDVDRVTWRVEPNPMDWDTENDGLLDGAEPKWKSDSDYDYNYWCDLLTNVYDPDSNQDNPAYPDDYFQIYVVFRTNAEDIDNDTYLDYNSNSWIVTDCDGEADLDSNSTLIDDMYIYTWVANVTNPSPIPSETIDITYGGKNKIVKTPDKRSVYLSEYDDVNDEYQYAWVKISATLYIKFEIDQIITKPSTNWEFCSVKSQPKSTNPGNYNFVYAHQETYDDRVCLNKDTDFDGLTNTKENYYGTNPKDSDSDDDGVPDGKEMNWNKDTDGDGRINAMDPDSDNDGLTDGTEMGITQPQAGSSNFKGTDVSATFWSWSSRKNYTADEDPLTKTNVTLQDTDNDGFYDGWDDVSKDGIMNASEMKGEDQNYDGNVDSTETDPLDIDTDDDGVPDSYIVNGVQYEGAVDSDGDGIINALEYDSDHDLIYDGTELGFTYGMVTNNTNQSKGYFVADQNPKNTTDPRDDDCDNDGILDGVEDADQNGAVDGDLDKDYVWDDEETWFETSPWNTDTDADTLNDGAEDSDHDAIVDDGETDPLKKDSDGDSLWDGWETNTGTFVSNTSTGTDPTEMDSDGDGLTDGQEVDGWTVAIYYQCTKEAKGDPYGVTSDPNFVDTDNDQMTDYEEFMNGSNPRSSDTDGDNILDHDEFLDDDDENTPTAFDGVAPKLDKFDVETVKKGGFLSVEYRITVDVRARDQAGVEWVSIKVEGQKTKKVYLYGDKSESITKEFKVDWGRSLGGGYDIWIKAQDVNGNEVKTKKHLDGILESIANGILSILSQIAKAIVALASMFIDFIWDAITYMMNTVLKPIIDEYNKWIHNIEDCLKPISSSTNGKSRQNDDSTEDSSSNSMDIWLETFLTAILLTSFAFLITNIGLVIGAILAITNVFVKIIAGLPDSLSSFVIPMIQNIFGSSGTKKVSMGIAALSLTFILGTFYSYIPEGDPIFGSNLNYNTIENGTEKWNLIELIMGIIILYLKFKSGSFELKSDATVLIICALGGYVIAPLIGSYWGEKAGALIGLIFAIIGLITTMMLKDANDAFGGLLSYIEEIIAGISLAYSVALTLKIFNIKLLGDDFNP
jgi:beta propeller repeat protein